MKIECDDYPLDIGGMELVDDATADYFYRELLGRPKNLNEEGHPDDELLAVASSRWSARREPKKEEGDQLISNQEPVYLNCIRMIIPGPNKEDEKGGCPIIEQILEMCDQEQSPICVLLKLMIPAIVNQRFIDLSTFGLSAESIIYYNQSSANAATLHKQLAFFEEDGLFEEAHHFLLQCLTDEYLESYLKLLRFMKSLGNLLVVNALSHSNDSSVDGVNRFIREFIATRQVDSDITTKINVEPVRDASMILVYPHISTPQQKSPAKNAHEYMFRKLLPSVIPCVDKLELKFDEDTNPQELTQVCLAMIRESVAGLAARRPNDHIFLVGWGVSSLLNMQAIQKVGNVTAVINFGFPIHGKHGYRGSVDDTICLSYCPSLFVVGDLAPKMSLMEVQSMRENMICESGLICVRGADGDLRVAPPFLNVERVTQHDVDGMILGHVTDFMRQVMGESGMSVKKYRKHLRPVKIYDSFDIATKELKNRASGFAPKMPEDPSKPKKPRAKKKKKDDEDEEEEEEPPKKKPTKSS